MNRVPNRELNRVRNRVRNRDPNRAPHRERNSVLTTVTHFIFNIHIQTFSRHCDRDFSFLWSLNENAGGAYLFLLSALRAIGE